MDYHSSLATLLANDGKALKFNTLTWPCHIIEEERSESCIFLCILVNKSMVYSYSNLTAQISASKSQNNDLGRTVSLCLLIRNYRFLVVMPHTIFFDIMVTVHIKATAPHHTTVLTASVKKNSTTRSFTHVISIRLSKNLAKDGTLAKSRRFWKGNAMILAKVSGIFRTFQKSVKHYIFEILVTEIIKKLREF